MSEAANEAAIIAAENAQARALNDQNTETSNPPPPAGSSHQDQRAANDNLGAGNDNAKPAKPLSPREEIARKFAERRRAEEEALGVDTDVVAYNESGSAIPPAVRAQEEATRLAAEAAAQEKGEADTGAQIEDKPKTYTLKVRGNDIPVASRDELLKLAEVEADEGTLYTDAALIRLAQKQLAASSYIEDAKGQAKTARQTARASDDTLSDDAVDEPDTDRPAKPSNTKDATREALEKIQFGDPEEAAKALDELIEARVDRRLSDKEQAVVMGAIEDEISTAAAQFEQANQDLFSTDYLAEAIYKGPIVAEIKADLVRLGASQEQVDKAIRDPVTALEVYTAARAQGKAVRTPTELLTAGADKFRETIGRPKAATATAPQATAPPATDRRDAKRALLPQPSRSATPPVEVKTDGQSTQARKAVIQNLRKARGQTIY
jgi:hypothetical protein